MPEKKDKATIESYLEKRGIRNTDLFKLMSEASQEPLAGTFIFAEGEEFELSHFLDASGVIGHDIADVNKALDLDNGSLVAIALVAGDDPICINVETGEITVQLVEEGIEKKLANTLKEFEGIIYAQDN